MDDSDVQPEKAPSAMTLNWFGIAIEVREVQNSKAPSSILFNVFGRVIV